MLEDLLKITDEIGFEDDGQVRCMSKSFDGDLVHLVVSIVILTADHFAQEWRVTCHGVRTMGDSGCGDSLLLIEESPLLMPYQTEHGSLSFRGKPDNVDAAIGALWRRHKQVVGDEIPFEQFVNSGSLWDLLEGGFGRLACGPIPLITAYEEVLQEHGIEGKVSQVGMPNRLVGDKLVEENGDVRLLLVGSEYVIAERFEATKIE